MSSSAALLSPLVATFVAPNLGGLSLLGNPWLDVGLVLLAGLFMGLINSMAGGGSFLSIPLLVALGLPAGTANGSIRVAIAAQNGVALATFHRKGVRAHALSARLIAPVLAGALVGSLLATRLDDALFRPLIGVVLLVWAVVLIIKPDRFLNPPDEAREPVPLTYALAGVIGVYGGFLQAGVGFPLIALLSGHLGYDLVKANSVKVTLMLGYTLIALPVFAFAGQIAWIPAGVLAAGNMAGGWLGARWQLAKGSAVVRWFVLVMVIIAGGLMLWPMIAARLG
ncbi:sulfite exporter TauE/SafE family protein [Pseudenhygromyxa sp. WMMC2535]|uniref:sulfite exporter TauE/SafE family protein n=1 Tax=Pseudenhygromyxa sp. WMMC2535 TaxID=2712867 RepID=UPI00155427B0|nr:sulfite exporter TauE/SafE family protein [Pseudenhygromyxa sp. WMMC2535]NVB39649.1 sulfite exporter TauE/SafE family protein [Pseudenhygromyxa sp. WMMC2535]